MLRTRLWMGCLLIAGLATGLWLDDRLGPPFPPGLPPYPCWLLMAVVVVAGACYELCQLLSRRGIQLNMPFIMAGVIAIALANWIPWLQPSAQPAQHLASVLSVVCVVNMLAMIREGIRFREPGTAVHAIGGSMLVTFYLGLLAAFLIELRWLSHGLLALGVQVAAAKCGDTGAYFGGRALGRHKLCPWLSPNKTVEGAVIGLAASALGACLVVVIGAKLTGGAPVLTIPMAGLVGLAVGVVAMVGDLVESLIKRDCQQKDSSELLPGFGGALDVLDSLLFSGPITYGLWSWLVA